MIDDLKESYSALEYTLAAASARAAELQAEGRITKIEASLFHPGAYEVHATPKPELPEVVEVPPIDLSNSTDLRLFTYSSKTAAESAAEIFRSEGRQTKLRPSVLHPRQWVVYCTRLPADDK